MSTLPPESEQAIFAELRKLQAMRDQVNEIAVSAERLVVGALYVAGSQVSAIADGLKMRKDRVYAHVDALRLPRRHASKSVANDGM